MRSIRLLSFSRFTAFTLSGVAIAACSPKPDTRSDARPDESSQVAGTPSGAGPDTMSSPVPSGDTSMSGMSGMDSVNPDQQFLRMMSDHHKGILLMAHDAIERKGVTVKAEAQKIDKAQDAELRRMVTMLKTAFKDEYTPKVTPENQAMADALKQKSGAAYDTTFRENAIKHHQEALQMIDEFLPKLTRPDLKQMAEKMKADQTGEIAKFKRELGQT